VTHRLIFPTVLRGTFVATIVALALRALCAGEADQSGVVGQDRRGPEFGPTVVRGRVTDEKGKPLADALVCVSVDLAAVAVHPAADGRSDANGGFRILIPGITQPKAIYIVAMKRLSGRRAQGSTGGGRWIQVAPGTVSNADLILNAPLYLAGTVVNEHGKPIFDVRITADTRSPKNAVGAVASTRSGSDGSFELVHYSLKSDPVEDIDGQKTALTFFHPDYVEVAIGDPYSLTSRQREALRIVLKTGHKVSGKVFDAAGQPVRNLTIKATGDAMTHRKFAEMDKHGQFMLQGLPDGPTVITTVDLRIKQSARVPLVLSGDQSDLAIRLQPMRIPKDLKAYTVFGMSLTDVTRELRSAYDLPNEPGVLVLDPGANPKCVSHHLAGGYVFSSIGEKRVRSVRELLAEILANVARDGLANGPLDLEEERRIAIWMIEPDARVRSSLKFTRSHLNQLRDVLDQCIAADHRAILALGRLGAQFRFKPAAAPGDHHQVGPEVALITLGNKWKGTDADLRVVSTLPVEGVRVRGPGKVSDLALVQLSEDRPDINVDRVSEAFLGVSYLPNEKTNQPEAISVRPDSPAARAGLLEGDVILEFAGKPVADCPALSAAMLTLKPGQVVASTLLRNGKTMKATIELGAWD
jgi:PDZ domain